MDGLGIAGVEGRTSQGAQGQRWVNLAISFSELEV